MLREPAIIARQAALIGHTLQNYRLDLGMYPRDDTLVRRSVRLNLWSELKQRYFPRGWGLLAALAGAGVLFVLGSRKAGPAGGLEGDLGRVGLVCLAAFLLDCFVELVGDGQRDLLKHLLLPNLLFDFLFIAAANTGAIMVWRWINRTAKAAKGAKLDIP